MTADSVVFQVSFNGHLIHPVGDFLFFFFFFRSLSRIGIRVVDDRQLSILYTLLY